MDVAIENALKQIGLGCQDVALLVDGRNCCYRAIYANRGDAPFSGVRYHSFVVMLRFIHSWMERFNPLDVHVFWDAPRQTLWRRKILETYKDRHIDPNRDDITDELVAVQESAQAMFKAMNVRQYLRKGQEADDLIYAACRVLRNRPCVIASSDSDFHQLIWHCHNVLVYEPKRNCLIESPHVDPVIQKALMGDNSDNILGYEQIGPVRSAALAGDAAARIAFLRQRGKDVYYRNMLLIDLNLCPYLLPNQMYVERTLMSDVDYNRKEALRIAQEYRINGIVQDYDRIVSPFRHLNVKPDKAYACPECGTSQFKCNSGWSCANGHGFGDPTPVKAVTESYIGGG